MKMFGLIIKTNKAQTGATLKTAVIYRIPHIHSFNFDSSRGKQHFHL